MIVDQTHCANDFSKESKRQTIYTQDVISALKELSFGDLEKPLEEFLEGLIASVVDEGA